MLMSLNCGEPTYDIVSQVAAKEVIFTMHAEEDATRDDCADDGNSIVGESNGETMIDSFTDVVTIASNLNEQCF